MTELKVEILKILVEMGLLALILFFLAYFVRRSLEKYRARNAYYQKLAEEKIAALKEIGLILSEQHLRFGRLLHILKQRPPTHQSTTEWQNDIMSAADYFDSHNQEKSALLIRNAIFATQQLGQRLISYQKLMLQSRDLIKDAISNRIPPNPQLLEQLQKSLSALLHEISVELTKPPTN